MNQVETDVCIVGAGPAGMMLGLLLAKRGIRTLVVESHANFDREYRGEVLQPLFVQMMDQLNLRDYLEERPHLKLERGLIYYEDKQIGSFDFSKIAPEYPYAMWMPQPILLNALYDLAVQLPAFQLWFHSPLKKLLKNENRVTGVVVDQNGQETSIHAKVTVGADGRFSSVRRLGEFEMAYDYYQHDLIWFTLEQPEHYDQALRFQLSAEHSYLLLPKYPNRIQGGIALEKGEWKQIEANGIERFRQELKQASELFHPFADSLHDFKPFTILQSKIQYVKEWAKEGCILIGDAAHCASPAGAIGVSLSVGTAIVAADVIRNALISNDVSAKQLGKVQGIRSYDISRIHRMQMKMEESVLSKQSWMKRIIPRLLPLLSKTPLMRYFQRRLLLNSQMLPIDSGFRFQLDEDGKYK